MKGAKQKPLMKCNHLQTSRPFVIDRPMRPLFPKDYRNDVTLNNLVLSVDPDCSPELTAMLGSAIATAISDIPFDGPTSTTQVGMIDGEFVFNPNAAQRAVSDMQLTILLQLRLIGTTVTIKYSDTES